MARRAAAFTQVDLSRALRGVKAGGIDVARIEIEPGTGKIVIVSASCSSSAEEQNPLDKWLKEDASKPQGH